MVELACACMSLSQKKLKLYPIFYTTIQHKFSHASVVVSSTSNFCIQIITTYKYYNFYNKGMYERRCPLSPSGFFQSVTYNIIYKPC